MVYRAVQVLAHHRVQHDNRLVLMYTGFIEENKKHSSFIAYTVYYISRYIINSVCVYRIS